ncbi:MAG TPA: tetratricopeptide repeat protein, partial [Opitutaceae bacterium]
LAIRHFVKCLEAGGAHRRPWDYPLVLTFSALAMASKSSTVILPAVLALCAWWMGTRRPGKIAGMLAPVLLMSVASAVLSVWTQQVEGADSPLWERNLPERLAVAGRVFWFYLGKLAWPRPLVFIYPRWQIESGHWTAYWASVSMGLVLVVAWLNRKGRFKAFFFASGYFVLALLPVLGLVDHFFLRYSFVGDHFQYLASMGPLALASAGISVGFRALGKEGRLFHAPFGAALLCVLGVLTWRQSANYKDAATLWRATLRANPDCWLALHNMGVAAAKEGRVDEAFADFHRTLAINPRYAEAHNNLGTLLMAKGSLDAAFEEYRKALETDGNNPEINRSAGVALLRMGRPDEAIVYFQHALMADPGNADVHNVLGVAFLKTSQLENAAAEFKRTVELSPAYAEGISNLGTALLDLGRLDEAVAQYRKAVDLAPGNPAFHRSLGIALSRQGNAPESDEQFREELRLRR